MDLVTSVGRFGAARRRKRFTARTSNDPVVGWTNSHQASAPISDQASVAVLMSVAAAY